MKTKLKLMFSLALVLSIGFIAACSDDDGDSGPKADKDELAAAVEEAMDLLTETDEGTDFGDYLEGSKADLSEAIELANDVLEDDDAEQVAVNNATTNMNAAIAAYQANFIAPIATTALIAHWSFDEGTGTSADDASANNFTGTFKTGPADWGAGFPEWTEDRKGVANKAVFFNEGGNIEVPYNTKLNPEKMTVSVWINAAEIRESNRFLGLQSWLGYKFQLQSTNRPFFSMNTAGGVMEQDATVELPIEEWHHIVATFGDGKLTFYVDGEFAATWDKPGVGKSIADKPYNLVIGQDFPTDKYVLGEPNGTNFDDPTHANYHVIPLGWGGYFHGSLDELRMYNTVLTGPQVVGLYNSEL